MQLAFFFFFFFLKELVVDGGPSHSAEAKSASSSNSDASTRHRVNTENFKTTDGDYSTLRTYHISAWWVLSFFCLQTAEQSIEIYAVAATKGWLRFTVPPFSDSFAASLTFGEEKIGCSMWTLAQEHKCSVSDNNG